MNTFFLPTHLKILQHLREHGQSTCPEISAETRVDVKKVPATMRILCDKSYGGVVEKVGRRKAGNNGAIPFIYDLDASTRSMSDDEFEAMLNERASTNPANAKPRNRRSYAKSRKLLEDDEAQDFMRLNAEFLTARAIASHLQEDPEVVRGALKVMGIDFSPEGKHPSNEDVMELIPYIPAGSRVDEWLGGTVIHMKSGQQGINSVIVHVSGA